MVAGTDDLVDHEHGLVNRTIFVDEDIYRRESEQIFGRCWLYVAHESQLTASGDFVATFMGEEPVIVCRAPGGRIVAFVNMCPRCGSLICRADEGRAEHFRCAYDGWMFNLHGRRAVGRPQAAADEEPMAAWELVPVAQVDSYKGCIFGTFDPHAPPLDVYLGDIRWGIDLLFEQGMLAVSGTARWLVDCNWKFAAESSVSDIEHGVVHLSGILANDSEHMDRQATEPSFMRPGFTIITEYGHGLNAELMSDAGAEADDLLLPGLGTLTAGWRQNPLTQRRLGSFRMQVRRACVTIFPNLAISTATRQLYVWHPRGPGRMEAVLISFAGEDDPPDVSRAFARAQALFGPAGLYGQDEYGCWEQSTRACRGALADRHPLNYQMGLGHGEIVDDERSPPRIDSLRNEHRQLWFYRNWVQALDAPNWQAWRRTRPRLPARV